MKPLLLIAMTVAMTGTAFGSCCETWQCGNVVVNVEVGGYRNAKGEKLESIEFILPRDASGDDLRWRWGDGKRNPSLNGKVCVPLSTNPYAEQP